MKYFKIEKSKLWSLFAVEVLIFAYIAIAADSFLWRLLPAWIMIQFLLFVDFGEPIPEVKEEVPKDDEGHIHQWGHYSGQHYEYCRICGERGERT